MVAGSNRLPGMHGLYVCETREVPVVESKDSLHPMNSHRCHEPRVMDLDARDLVVTEQSAPFQVNG